MREEKGFVSGEGEWGPKEVAKPKVEVGVAKEKKKISWLCILLIIIILVLLGWFLFK